jgi:hypothetical protein
MDGPTIAKALSLMIISILTVNQYFFGRSWDIRSLGRKSHCLVTSSRKWPFVTRSWPKHFFQQIWSSTIGTDSSILSCQDPVSQSILGSVTGRNTLSDTTTVTAAIRGGNTSIAPTTTLRCGYWDGCLGRLGRWPGCGHGSRRCRIHCLVQH